MKLETVLIPAGKFMMGSPEREKPIVGKIMLAISGFVLLALIAVIFIRAWKKWEKRFRPKYALACLVLYLLLMVCAVLLPFLMSRPLMICGVVLLVLIRQYLFAP